MTAMTELFYRDPYACKFTSKVTSCVEGEMGFEVMLEDTAFYPEGGGQPADHGTIDGAAVFDVRRTPGSGDIFLPCSGAVIKKSLKRRAETWKTKPNSCSSATRITTGS